MKGSYKVQTAFTLPLVTMHKAQWYTCRRPGAGVTWGFLSFFGGGSYRIRILMYFDVSCMYPDRILMCPVYIHQDTTRYNKIHLQIRTSLDTIEIHVSHYVSLMYPACILYVSSNHCRYMYLICIPHVSRMYPTCKIHVS